MTYKGGKRQPSQIPQFFCLEDKRSFRIREERGRGDIPLKNLHQGQKPDRKALLEGKQGGGLAALTSEGKCLESRRNLQIVNIPVEALEEL
jgi:hypothetical protein